MKQIIKGFLRRLGSAMLAGQAAQEDLRTASVTKAALVSYTAHLQGLARSGGRLPRLEDCGFRVFSQFEEDGYLLYLAAVFEITSKLFIDIGAADGVNSNCANLALNLGWHGLFVDGSIENVRRGEAFYAQHLDTSLYPPVFRQAMVTRENINSLISDAGFRGRVGILSIDIDGNDYWIWDALEIVVPAIVVIETHIEFGLNNVVVPYDANYVYPGRIPNYFGASPVAMVRLAHRKGYRLVGANRFGFNLIFAKRGMHEDRVPTVPLEQILQHPRYAERLALFEGVKSLPYVTPDP
jgi:hypothetical protein